MAYFNEIPSGQATYLESQMRWYKQEAWQVLEQIKKLVRGDGGTERVDLRIDYPLFVVNKMLLQARSHFGKQAILLGSSSLNELSAQLAASAIGLDVQPELKRDEVAARIDRLVRALEGCKGGDIPVAPWVQVALMAALRAISSAVA